MAGRYASHHNVSSHIFILGTTGLYLFSSWLLLADASVESIRAHKCFGKKRQSPTQNVSRGTWKTMWPDDVFPILFRGIFSFEYFDRMKKHWKREDGPHSYRLTKLQTTRVADRKKTTVMAICL